MANLPIGNELSPYASQALKILSLRLPQLLGGAPIAPDGLLNPQVRPTNPAGQIGTQLGVPPALPRVGPTQGATNSSLTGNPVANAASNSNAFPQLASAALSGQNPIDSTQPLARTVGPGITSPQPNPPIPPPALPPNPNIQFGGPGSLPVAGPAPNPAPVSTNGIMTTGQGNLPRVGPAATNPMAGLAALISQMMNAQSAGPV